MLGSGEEGLAALHAKIRACGDDLKAWGDTKAKPVEKEIKALQDVGELGMVFLFGFLGINGY